MFLYPEYNKIYYKDIIIVMIKLHIVMVITFEIYKRQTTNTKIKVKKFLEFSHKNFKAILMKLV